MSDGSCFASTGGWRHETPDTGDTAVREACDTAGVQVLLSTYNGEAYLRQQMESLFSQVGVTVRVLVRDDGSTDGTPALLADWAAKFPLRVRLLPAAGRIGPMRSFAALMAASEAERSSPKNSSSLAFCMPTILGRR